MDSSTHAEPVHQPPSEESVRAGHEVRDVNIRVLLWLGAAVAGVIVVVLLVVAWLASGLESLARSADPQLSPLAETAPTSAAPRLQDTPVRDYQEFRRQQKNALHSYGWVDRKEKIVHLPIARAKELILKEGLPEPKAESTKGTVTEEPGDKSEEQP
jgi:hypothetical protein